MRQRLNDLDDRVVGPGLTRADVFERFGFGGVGAGAAFASSGRLAASVVAFVLGVGCGFFAQVDRRRDRASA
jgi:hypothetical protein